ncbi:hypothetical protein [Streptomyces longwoodensis]|uniref:hypothetical protein n=1 Tax=Streptomyces longwoodensis TaxID=68231 RepID=UPI0033EC596C
MDQADNMMNLPRPRWPLQEIAVIGGTWEDDLAIAGGYLRVAEICATHWSRNGPDDSLPVPILYNYRHSVELSLKWLIRVAARIVRRGGYDTHGMNLERKKVEGKLRGDSHSIRKLAERLNTYLVLISDLNPPNNRIDDESMETLHWLDQQDETGETFRYSMIGRGGGSRPARPTPTNINFYEEVNKVHLLAHLLQAGYSAYLDHFEELQQEYLEEMRKP